MAEVLMDFPQLTMTLPDGREESIMKRTTLVSMLLCLCNPTVRRSIGGFGSRPCSGCAQRDAILFTQL